MWCLLLWGVVYTQADFWCTMKHCDLSGLGKKNRCCINPPLCPRPKKKRKKRMAWGLAMGEGYEDLNKKSQTLSLSLSLSLSPVCHEMSQNDPRFTRWNSPMSSKLFRISFDTAAIDYGLRLTTMSTIHGAKGSHENHSGNSKRHTFWGHILPAGSASTGNKTQGVACQSISQCDAESQESSPRYCHRRKGV